MWQIVHEMDHLFDVFVTLFQRGDVNRFGIMSYLFCHVADNAIQRGGKKHGLARYPCLQSLEAEECGKKDENVPSLVLRAMKQGERLWDIAKLYRTTVEAILAANELKEESAAVIGKLLLIPRRR